MLLMGSMLPNSAVEQNGRDLLVFYTKNEGILNRQHGTVFGLCWA